MVFFEMHFHHNFNWHQMKIDSLMLNQRIASWFATLIKDSWIVKFASVDKFDEENFDNLPPNFIHESFQTFFSPSIKKRNPTKSFCQVI